MNIYKKSLRKKNKILCPNSDWKMRTKITIEKALFITGLHLKNILNYSNLQTRRTQETKHTRYDVEKFEGPHF